jgi:DNA-binding protein HU-beta
MNYSLMSKTHYVEKIALDNRPRKLPKQAIKEMVDQTFDFILESLKQNQKFTYAGFGTFRLKVRKEKQGVHPNTGEKLTVRSRTAISFTASDKLKKTLS